MKKLHIIYIMLLALLPIGAAAQGKAKGADAIMEACARRIASAPSIEAKFSLSFGEKTSPCDMVISKNRYTLTSPDMRVWFDGVTMWTYITGNKTLTITEPTVDELLECNPFAIVNHYKKAYKCSLKGGDANSVELTPAHKGSSIRKAVITVNPKTQLPAKVVVTLANGQVFSATMGTIAVGKNLPASTFVYNKTKYPATEISDLR